LETQLGKLAKIVKEDFETNFTTNIEVNPKKHCNAIITRSGNVYEKREEEKNDGKNENGKKKIENKKEDVLYLGSQDRYG